MSPSFRRASCSGAEQQQPTRACCPGSLARRPRTSCPSGALAGATPPTASSYHHTHPHTCTQQSSAPASSSRPSVKAACCSNETETRLSERKSWSSATSPSGKAKAIALPPPLRALEQTCIQLLQLLGIVNASEYAFTIYKAEVGGVQHPPPAGFGINPLDRTVLNTAKAAADHLLAPSSLAANPLAAASLAWNDVSRIQRLAFPLMAQNVFEYLMTIVCTISIGRLGAAELAASSLANSVYIVTGLSMALGLSSAMETLCGQAFGAKEYKSLGDVLQRALLVCWAACIPVGLLWMHSTSLMLAMGQTPQVAAMAGRYLELCIPCIFLNIGTDCMKKYLQAQHIVSPGMYANALSTLLAPLYFHVLVQQLALGLDGAAMAFILCQLTSFVGLGVYIMWHSAKNAGSKTATWGGFSLTAAFSKWGQYLQYGLPAMMMISLEWWVYQVPIVMIGWLPNAQAALGVGGICVAFNGWAYMVALGLSQAVNTCVSNALGAGDGAGARRYAALGFGCMVLVEAALVAGVSTFGEQLVRTIASDPAVVALALRTMPVLCGVMFMDGLNTILYGVVRGTGEQAVGSLISGSYLVVATALTYGLNFALPPGVVEHLPLLGGMEPVARIWMGVVMGAVCQFAVLATYISKWDWAEQASKAASRATSVVSH